MPGVGWRSWYLSILLTLMAASPRSMGYLLSRECKVIFFMFIKIRESTADVSHHKVLPVGYTLCALVRVGGEEKVHCNCVSMGLL